MKTSILHNNIYIPSAAAYRRKQLHKGSEGGYRENANSYLIIMWSLLEKVVHIQQLQGSLQLHQEHPRSLAMEERIPIMTLLCLP